MADDIVTISFSNGSFVDGSGDQATFSGSVTVDYTAGTVDGNFKVEGDGFGDSGNFSRLLVQNGDQYTASGEGFSVIYTGQNPDEARFQLVANNNDTYDTANNPAGTRTEPVSSTGSAPNVCFLRGSRIATPFGEVPVEALRPGDAVTTVIDGRTASAVIGWVGSRRARVRGADAAPEAYPVRIRAGAVRDGVPRADLLVTAEHCILLDGRLVPARMLVNGASIVVDSSITEYEFFHVELDRHSILLAEGLEAESYLDTGNRRNFDGAVQAMQPDFRVDPAHRSWADDAAAPLCVDRAVVEPIWRDLAARAEALGFPLPPFCSVDHDPQLRIVTGSGVEIAPERDGNGMHRFVIPADARALRLVSRSARPSDAVGPFLDDRRTLGVLIGRIEAEDGQARRAFIRHLEAAALPGWHAVEDGRARWTAGNAVLPLDPGLVDGRPLRLAVEVLGAGPYPAPRRAA